MQCNFHMSYLLSKLTFNLDGRVEIRAKTLCKLSQMQCNFHELSSVQVNVQEMMTCALQNLLKYKFYDIMNLN